MRKLPIESEPTTRPSQEGPDPTDIAAETLCRKKETCISLSVEELRQNLHTSFSTHQYTSFAYETTYEKMSFNY